ncbi:hypothetical protein DsansV1_C11g0111901 [Dioscorea sansibarensis]
MYPWSSAAMAMDEKADALRKVGYHYLQMSLIGMVAPSSLSFYGSSFAGSPSHQRQEFSSYGFALNGFS